MVTSEGLLGLYLSPPTAPYRFHDSTHRRSLGVGSVDLLLIHSPRPWSGSPSRCSVAETWAVLEEAQAAGQARSIGVSNFQISDLEMLATTAKVRPRPSSYLACYQPLSGPLAGR